MISRIRDWSADESADPVGRHRPWSKHAGAVSGPDEAGPGEGRLEVKGLPCRSGLDVGVLQGQPHLLPICPEALRIDEDACQPVIGHTGWITRHGRDPGDADQSFRIRRINPLAPVDAAVETPELGSAKGGQQVGEAVVVPHHVVLVVCERLPGLSGQIARSLGPRPRPGHQHPAATGGDDFVAIEREDPRHPERTRRPAPMD